MIGVLKVEFLNKELSKNSENDSSVEMLSQFPYVFLDSDDFAEIFSSKGLKISYILLSIINEIFNNVASLLLILHEKYGGDPMKRSINNQLVVHAQCGMILRNLITTPIWIARFLVGPLHKKIATFCSFWSQTISIWQILCYSEVAVLKSLMVFKWPLIAAMNDHFVGFFLILVNFGFLFITQISRLILGSFSTDKYFELLYGVKLLYEDGTGQMFLIIYLGFTMVISSICMISRQIKLIFEEFKEQQLKNRARVVSTRVAMDGNKIPKYNNSKYNPDLMSGKASLLIFTSILLLVCLILIGSNRNYGDGIEAYWWVCYQELIVMNTVYKIILPIAYIIYKKDFRDYVKSLLNFH